MTSDGFESAMCLSERYKFRCGGATEKRVSCVCDHNSGPGMAAIAGSLKLQTFEVPNLEQIKPGGQHRYSHKKLGADLVFWVQPCAVLTSQINRPVFFN